MGLKLLNKQKYKKIPYNFMGIDIKNIFLHL